MQENQRIIGKIRVIDPRVDRRAVKLFENLDEAREFVKGTRYVLEYRLAQPPTARRGPSTH